MYHMSKHDIFILLNDKTREYHANNENTLNLVLGDDYWIAYFLLVCFANHTLVIVIIINYFKEKTKRAKIRRRVVITCDTTIMSSIKLYILIIGHCSSLINKSHIEDQNFDGGFSNNIQLIEHSEHSSTYDLKCRSGNPLSNIFRN